MEYAIARCEVTYRVKKRDKDLIIRKLHRKFSKLIKITLMGSFTPEKLEYLQLDERWRDLIKEHFITAKKLSGIDSHKIFIPDFTDTERKRKFINAGEITLSDFKYNAITGNIVLKIVFYSEEFILLNVDNGHFLLNDYLVENSDHTNKHDSFTLAANDKWYLAYCRPLS